MDIGEVAIKNIATSIEPHDVIDYIDNNRAEFESFLKRRSKKCFRHYVDDDGDEEQDREQEVTCQIRINITT